MKFLTTKFFCALIYTSLMITALGIQPAHAASFSVANAVALIAAINTANTNNANDTITLTANITLTVTDNTSINGANGLPIILADGGKSLTINGGGFTIARSTAGGTPNFRIFEINSGANLTLTALTISNGYCAPCEGAGIYNNSSSLTMTDITLSNNSSDNSIGTNNGGGMSNNNSNPTLNNVMFNNNAAYDGGGMYNFHSNPTLNNVTFNNNSASNSLAAIISFGGGMYNTNSSNPTLMNVTFNNNSADFGGGMFNDHSSPMLINVTFMANSAIADGGGMYSENNSNPTLADVTFRANTAPSYGGGMYNIQSSPTLSKVTFSRNSVGIVNGASSLGGGMYNDNNSSPTLTDVTFHNNSANGGSGMYNGNKSNPKLTNITFSNNFASNNIGMSNSVGAGILNYDSSPTLTNVTFSSNSADFGGGLYNDFNSNPTLTNVTFSANSASVQGGGIFNANNSSPILKNVIIANSTSGGDCGNNTSTLNAASSNNLIEDASNACGLTNGVNGNIIGSDPKLGPLANNGGFTQTMALISGSPAIDAGTNTGCPATDQRGTTRPLGTRCDIGAYEAPAPVITTASSLPVTGFAPNRVTSLLPQPANLAYVKMSDIWLEIPSLGIKTNIVGVPKINNTWDVSWLGNNTGWLNGTAFPTWEGNSVVTGHVFNASGLPGPFVNLKNLKYGAQIIVHLAGQKYIFEITKTTLVRPNVTSFAYQHLEGSSYLTLITCQGYDEKSDIYRFRRILRAVLVDVQ